MTNTTGSKRIKRGPTHMWHVPRRFLLAGNVVLALAFGLPLVAAPASSVPFGSDVSGAPFEYYLTHSRAATDFDGDLPQGLGTLMDTTFVVTNRRFDDLGAAVKTGRFQMALSAISDTSQREKLVDFVDYFVAGAGIMASKGNPYRISSLKALCGHSVTVESGTSYEGDLRTHSDACEEIGLGAIRILTFPTDDEAFGALLEGKSTAYIADYPVGGHHANIADAGKGLEILGEEFDVVPCALAVGKRKRGFPQRRAASVA